MSKTILITGGSGYIGSHTCLAMLENGYKIVVLDNLSNSSIESIRRVENITKKNIDFIEGNICNIELLDNLFKEYDFYGVIHFAGMKSVGESSAIPIDYYYNNVSGTISLCRAMEKAGVFSLVFSSSATVYGDSLHPPTSEDSPTTLPTNPYGRTKLFAEHILRDVAAADNRWNIAVLRYFNPVGAHKSGQIGEDPHGTPNNLLPFISKVVTGHISELKIFGADYPTSDGTGVRDYIHVMDLALGHISAFNKILNVGGLHIWNLGRGEGFSVLEVLKKFEMTIGQSIPYRVVPRREGDVTQCWADVIKAKRELNWSATRSLDVMLEDTWRWVSNNPNGYSTL